MSEPEFPRYFRNIHGFVGEVWFVRAEDANQVSAVFHDGTSADAAGWTLDGILECVTRGVWAEVPRDMAAAMIRKARGEQ